MRMPRWWGQVNKRLFNPRVLATGQYPVLWHQGRSTGTTYRTPLSAYEVGGGYLFQLVYGAGADWVRNVRAAGRARLSVDGRDIVLVNPRVIGVDEARRLQGKPGARGPAALRVAEYLHMDIAN